MSLRAYPTGSIDRGRALKVIGVASTLLVGIPIAVRAQQQLDKIRIAGVPTEDATNMYYALKTGMFERAGIALEMVDTSSGSAAVAAMVSGTYEMARPSMLSMVLAHARGVGVTLITAANVHDSRRPLALLQAAPDATIRSGADLNNKVIGIPALNDINSIAVRAWCEKNGGDWRSLKFVEMPNTLFEGALASHRIDAAVMQSPFLFSSLEARTTKTVGDAWGAIAPRFCVGVNVARSNWAAANGPLLARFAKAYKAATIYVNAHKEETAPYVVELTKMELATVQRMHRAINPTDLRIAEIQPVIDAAARYGVIPESFSARAMLQA